MQEVVIRCDGCGEEIDIQTEPMYVMNGSGISLPTLTSPVNLHFHLDHVPEELEMLKPKEVEPVSA